MNLNTLHHGSFHILVTDIRCPKCRRYILHYRFEDTIFYLNRTHAFTRELVDVWIMDILRGTSEGCSHNYTGDRKAVGGEVYVEQNLGMIEL